MSNKSYSTNQIPKVNVEKHLVKQQQMYFGSCGANPVGISSSIAEGALILGAGSTLVTRRSDWWFVCADVDWLLVPTTSGLDDKTVFETVWAFPEAGLNSIRSEVFARVFSDQAYSLSERDLHRVKGDFPDDQTILANAKTLGDWKRIIGFRFKSPS